MAAFLGALKNYYRRDIARAFWLQQKLFWVPYERYEYTRLSHIRTEMDQHRTYKKETILGDEDEEGVEGEEFTDKSANKATADKGSFIWTFLIRPVH